MSENSEERTYYHRTICMYMDLTKNTLLKLFKYLINSYDIGQFLTSVDTIRKLFGLFKNGYLNKTEYNLVSSSRPDPEKFDIALLIRLILGLFRNDITEPALGWKNKPQPKDESLGADLIRLRDVRNKLIGHRADAKLSQAEYHKIWDKVQAILERVVEKIDPQSKTTLLQTISAYKEFEVHTGKTKVKWYLDQLNEYKNEFEKLQNKVEELSKKSKEFHVYFQRTPERYVRYIKLLFDGGRLVLCGIFERELHKYGQGLNSLLIENQEILQSHVHREYLSYLFPIEPSNIDHTIWDVDLLASVILLVFTDLSTRDIINIEEVKCARLNYADHAFSCLDEDQFLEIWTDLISNLKDLSMNIDEDKKLQVEGLIDLYKKKSEGGNADEYLDHLRESGVPVKTLKAIHSETVYRLRLLMRQLDERGIKFKTGHVLDLKLLTTCQNEKKKKDAEDFLEKHLEASLNKSDTPTNFIRMETDKFFASISTHPDVKPTGIKRKCIILSFRSSTPGGLLYLLDYFDSQHFKSRLNNISNELNYLYEDAFLLLGNTTLESMSSNRNFYDSQLHKEDIVCDVSPTERKSDHGIILPLSCSSVEGMEHVLATLKSEKTTNRLKSIADKISVQVRETVTINVSPDLLELKDVFEETDTKGSGSCGYYEKDGMDRYLEQDKSKQSIATITDNYKQILFYEEDTSSESSDSSSEDDFEDTTVCYQGDYEDGAVDILSEPETNNCSISSNTETLKQLPFYGEHISSVSSEGTSKDDDTVVFIQAHSNKSLKKDTEQSMESKLQDPRECHDNRTLREFTTKQYVESLYASADEQKPNTYYHLRHPVLSVTRRNENFDMSSEPVKGTTQCETEYEGRELRKKNSVSAEGFSKTSSYENHFDKLFQTAARSFREMLNNISKVTEEGVKALEARIEDLFHLQDTTMETGSGMFQWMFPGYFRPKKKEYEKRLEELQKEFTTFKHVVMKKVVTEDELYITKKQELREFLIVRYMGTYDKERLYGGRSMFWKLQRLFSRKRGHINSCREIFYDKNRKYKNICIVGEERLATEMCLDFVNGWCDKPKKGFPEYLVGGRKQEEDETIRKEFEYVFMISLSDAGEDIFINDIVKKNLLTGKYADIFEKVIARESEKCLIILDGLSQWKAKRYMNMPKRHLMDDYVVLMTASHVETMGNFDQVLYFSM